MISQKKKNQKKKKNKKNQANPKKKMYGRFGHLEKEIVGKGEEPSYGGQKAEKPWVLGETQGKKGPERRVGEGWKQPAVPVGSNGHFHFRGNDWGKGERPRKKSEPQEVVQGGGRGHTCSNP